MIIFHNVFFFIRIISRSVFSTLLFVLITSTSFGYEMEVKPELTLKESYDDNIDFTSRDQLEDFITTASPSLNLGRNAEKTDIKLSAGADAKKYVREDQLDDIDDNYTLEFEYDHTFQLSFNFTGNFTRDSTIDSELEETGLLSTRVDREKSTLQPALGWWISERYGIRCTPFYQRVIYDSPQFLDYDIYAVLLEGIYALPSEKTILFMQAGYGLADYDIGTLDNYGFLFGMDFTYNPKWSLNFRGGVQQTILETDLSRALLSSIGILKRSERFLEPIGYISLKRSFEKGSASAEFRKEIVPSGQNASLDRLTAKINVDYSFTERLKCTMEGSWSSSASLIRFLQTDEELYSFSLSAEYRIWEKISTTLSYKHSSFENHEADTDATRNTTYLQLTGYWQWFFQD